MDQQEAAPYGSVVQLVRTLACHARGHGFESRQSRHVPDARKFACVRIGKIVGSLKGLWMVGLRRRLRDAYETTYPGVAQLVERVIWDHEAAGSRPVTWTTDPAAMWRSGSSEDMLLSFLMSFEERKVLL